jgi:predicted TIM-barrel fold metal-dependent hydrolase
MKKLPIFDVHAHFLNLDCIPDDLSKNMAGFSEDYAKNWFTRNLLKIISKIIPGINHAGKFLDIHRKEISNIAEEYFNTGLVDITAPIVMDLAYASKSKEGVMPYEEQVTQMSRVAANNPWRVFPFIMFDPRRPNALEIVKQATGEMGYIGIKLYPSIGYNISAAPHRSSNQKEADKMKELYEFCEKHDLPITIHCSPGGAYKVGKKGEHSELANPIYMLQTLNEYRLRVNFAHFGGDPSDQRSREWRDLIIDFMRLPTPGKAYADISYSDGKDISELEEVLEDPQIGDRLLFGTDWSLVTHKFTLQEYFGLFSGLSEENKNRLLTHNPVKFLFGEKVNIPQRYDTFLEMNNPEGYKQSPEWIVQE